MTEGSATAYALRGAAGLSAVVLAICLSPIGASWERAALDTLFAIRGAVAPPAEIVVVRIDEASFREIGKKWPWPRSVHAALIKRLSRAGAAVIALDLIFAERSAPEEDEALARELRYHANVVLAMDISVSQGGGFAQEIRVEPIPALLNADTALGFVNMPLDSDGFIRRLEPRRGELTSFPLRAVEVFSHGECCAERASIRASEGMLINFAGPPGALTSVSYYQALAPGEYLAPDFFRDKLVFVGVDSHSGASPNQPAPDYFPSPFSRWGYGYMAGVELQANAAYNLLHGNHLREMSTALAAVVSLGIVLASAWCFCAARRLAAGALCAAALLALGGGTYAAFARLDLYLPLLTLSLPMLACYGLSLIARRPSR